MSNPEEAAKLRQAAKAVLGQGSKPAPFATPPANIPGVRGQLPLPSGQPVDTARTISPRTLTAEERAVLGNVQGKPLPANLAKQLQAAVHEMNEAAAQASSELPVSPDTPPVEVPEAVTLASLPADKQSELRQAVEQARQTLQQTAVRKPRESVTASLAAAEAHGSFGTVPSNQRGPLLDVVNDLQESPVTSPAAPEAEDPSPEPEPAEDVQNVAGDAWAGSEGSGVKLAMRTCPHCLWDLSLPTDGVELTSSDKQAYLTAILGQQPWLKSYPLFGGNVVLTLRTLRTYELDMCYAQCFADVKAGRLQPGAEMEYLQRYRASLQIAEFRTLQQSFSAPLSVEEWPLEPVAGDDNTPLYYIHETVRTRVLLSESIHRVVARKVAQFNRLVAKMEDCAESPDFWETTR